MTSLLAEGLSCTVGELQSGQLRARLILEFAKRNAVGTVFRDLAWRGVAEKDLLGRLQRLQRDIINGERPDLIRVRLSAMYPRKNYMEERRLKVNAALAAARGVPLRDISNDHINRTILKEIHDRGECLWPGCPAKAAMLLESLNSRAPVRTIFENDFSLLH